MECSTVAPRSAKQARPQANPVKLQCFRYICSTMRGRIKGTDSIINAILATAVLYELRWKIWNGAE